MERELVVRIRITRPAARLALGAALLWVPAGTLTPATKEVVLSTVVSAPVAAFTTARINGKALLATNNGADVVISTTSCVPNAPGGGWAQYVLDENLVNFPTTICQGDNESQRGVRVLTNQHLTPSLVAERYKTKLFVRGHISINRLIWHDNTTPGQTPTREYTYWPDEITGFAATQCAGGYNATTGECAFGTFDPAKAEVILRWTVKNGTGPSPGHYRTFIRRTSDTNLNNALVSMRSNIRMETNAPTTNGCNATEPCGGGVPCPTGRKVCIRGCKYTIQLDPNTGQDADLAGECRFKIEQNVTETFPYQADNRVMCVKMSQARWDSECAPISNIWARHPDCRMRCPADPDSISCPYNPACGTQVQRCQPGC